MTNVKKPSKKPIEQYEHKDKNRATEVYPVGWTKNLGF